MLTFIRRLIAQFRKPELSDVYQITWPDGRVCRIILSGGMCTNTTTNEVVYLNVYDYRTDGFRMHAELTGDEWKEFVHGLKAAYLGKYCMAAMYNGTFPERLK